MIMIDDLPEESSEELTLEECVEWIVDEGLKLEYWPTAKSWVLSRPGKERGEYGRGRDLPAAVKRMRDVLAGIDKYKAGF
mgnify:CR=1 FL=1